MSDSLNYILLHHLEKLLTAKTLLVLKIISTVFFFRNI